MIGLLGPLPSFDLGLKTQGHINCIFRFKKNHKPVELVYEI